MNMFRLDAPEGKAQLAAAWSPPLVGDFHVLERFGQLVFVDEKGDIPPPPAPPSAAVVKGRREALDEGLKGMHGGAASGNNGALRIDERKAPASLKAKKAAEADSKRK
jgi:hypothetical protein